MPGNANFDTLLSTTLANFTNKLEDNIFTARPLIAFLKRKDQIKSFSGGNKIVEQLAYAKNTSSGSFSGYDSLNVDNPGEFISAAEYRIGEYYATVAISNLEELQNDSDEKLLDLLESRVWQAQETIIEDMNTMFYGDGTGNSNKDWFGLKALVGNASTTPTTVGNIDTSGSNNTWWRSYVSAPGSDTALTLGDMRTAFNTPSRGSDSPDFIITTQTLFEKYEGMLQPGERFVDQDTADGGFQNLTFKTRPVMFDTACTAKYMYFLNSKYLRLRPHSKQWLDATPFVKPRDKAARYSQILCAGNLTCSNRSRQGVLRDRV